MDSTDPHADDGAGADALNCGSRAASLHQPRRRPRGNVRSAAAQVPGEHHSEQQCMLHQAVADMTKDRAV
jgi:hypothetical protein